MAFFVIRRNPLADFQDHNYNENRYPQKRGYNQTIFGAALIRRNTEPAVSDKLEGKFETKK